ncbi:MAG: ABC transporter permease [Candidatus Promineifilaceae bacterium]|jgi:NitT/TauT family transport system permease protein
MQRILRFLDAQPTWLTILASLIFLLIAWQLLVIVGGYPAFILPGPADVWSQFQIVLADGRLLHHSLITISEIIPGLLIGLLIAVPLGYILAKSPLAERLLSPYLIASQAIPIIAIAPLLTIWISSTYWSRVTVAVLVVFFPILVNSITGMRSVPPEMVELMHSLNATRGQIFRKLELPAAMPVLLAGLKVGATLAVIGALVGEFVQPRSAGLGYMLVTARYQFKTDLVFVLLITLAVIALTLYGIVVLLERRLLYWQKRPENSTALSKQTRKDLGWETAPEKARYVEEEI